MKITTVEAISTVLALISISILGASLIEDFQPAQQKEETKGAISALNTTMQQARGRIFTLQEYNDLAIKLPTIPWQHTLPYEEAKKLPPKEQGEIVQQNLLETKIATLEQRVSSLESKPLSAWIAFKGIVIWFLSTFFSPVVVDLSKKLFKIK